MAELNKLKPQSRTTEVDTASDRILAEFDKSELGSDTFLTGSSGVTKTCIGEPDKSDKQDKGREYA